MSEMSCVNKTTTTPTTETASNKSISLLLAACTKTQPKPLKLNKTSTITTPFNSHGICNIITVKGAIKALELSSDWFAEINDVYAKRRALTWQILDALNCEYNKENGGMFVWAKLPEGITSEQMTDKMLYDKDVFLTPGTVFGSNGEGYIRLSLCVPENKLKEVLLRVS